MNWKAWLLPIVMFGALGSVYLLPKSGSTAQSAVRMELPDFNGGWKFEQKPPSQEETSILSSDTEFSKAVCLRPRAGEFTWDGRMLPDRLELSIVLSGHDLNNSIHRPERCMPAQGHHIMSTSDVFLKLDNRKTLPTQRILSVQTIKSGANAKPQDTASFKCVTYYFFVGHDRLSNSHTKRTMIDIKDRLLYGRDQRWAYVSVSMWYGKLPWLEKEVPEAEADKKLQDFIARFAEEQIDWGQIKG